MIPFVFALSLCPKRARLLTDPENDFLAISMKLLERAQASMAGMTDLQRLDFLTRLITKRDKERDYNRHNFKLIMDMDNLVGDMFPTITTWPKPPFTITHKTDEQWFMHFIYRKGGRESEVGHMQVG